MSNPLDLVRFDDVVVLFGSLETKFPSQQTTLVSKVLGRFLQQSTRILLFGAFRRNVSVCASSSQYPLCVISLLSNAAKRLATALWTNTSLTSLSLPQNPLGPKGATHLGERMDRYQIPLIRFLLFLIL